MRPTWCSATTLKKRQVRFRNVGAEDRVLGLDPSVVHEAQDLLGSFLNLKTPALGAFNVMTATVMATDVVETFVGAGRASSWITPPG